MTPTLKPKNRTQLHNLKIILFFGILLTISLAFASFSGKSQNLFSSLTQAGKLKTDDLQSWKTYPNKNYNFKLQLPPDWQLHSPETDSSQSDTQALITLTPPTMINSPDQLPEAKFSLYLFISSQVSAADLLAQLTTPATTRTYFQNDNLNGILIFNPQATEKNTYQKTLLMENGDYTYQVEVVWNQNHPAQEKILSQILNSFSFYKIYTPPARLLSPDSCPQ